MPSCSRNGQARQAGYESQKPAAVTWGRCYSVLGCGGPAPASARVAGWPPQNEHPVRAALQHGVEGGTRVVLTADRLCIYAAEKAAAQRDSHRNTATAQPTCAALDFACSQKLSAEESSRKERKKNLGSLTVSVASSAESFAAAPRLQAALRGARSGVAEGSIPFARSISKR